MDVRRQAAVRRARAWQTAFQAKLRSRIETQDAGYAHIAIHMPQEACARVNQERRCHRQVIIHSHRMSGGGEITILSQRHGESVRAIEMRTEILGVIERDLALAAEVLIHLDERYDFVRMGKLPLVPILYNLAPGRAGDQSLDFLRPRMH